MDPVASLQPIIDDAWERRSEISPSAAPANVKDAVARVLAELDAGRIRVAEKRGSEWITHQWVKKAVLLSFRLRDNEIMQGGFTHYYDKVDSKFARFTQADFTAGGYRVVPPAAARHGAFIAKNVVLMPSYVNVGAYVDEGTLIDSHALVGSCAQIGRRVHLSAAAQIGGVLEPVGALPVIVEDDVLVGGNTGIYEGTVVKQRAVVAAGVVLTGSTPLYDLPRGVIIRAAEHQPLIVPEGAVVVPGARAVTTGAGREWGLSLATPVIVKYRDDRTDTRTELEAWIR
jgi:2,3,4,5-tetrahydropyridine-2,6-dicarboxylate N-succinyltransferase